MKNILILLLTLTSVVYTQQNLASEDLLQDKELAEQLNKIVNDLDLNKDFDVGEDGIEQISLAIIDLSKNEPAFAGVNPDNFIYPASVYKMYVAAEILHQISDGKYSLYQKVVADTPNVVDKSKLPNDPRPVLSVGDTVTINYLLDLMITRSDNSAANMLIDLAERENINALLHFYGWNGSEVTRKFLKRKFEDPSYKEVRGTETCAKHAADFLFKIYENELVNPWVSMQMRTFLGRQLDNSKLSQGLPNNTMFYHKTGWFAYWANDAGIVDDGKVKYVIACFLPIEEDKAQPIFKEISARIYSFISGRL